MAAILGMDPARLLRATDPAVSPVSQPLTSGDRFTGGHMLATWNHGIASNEEGWRQMQAGGTALDAVVEGTAVVESDPTGSSVGLGGRPDRDGKSDPDACVMNAAGDAGGVCFLEDIEHPVRVARAVMEETPHVLLAEREPEISQSPRDSPRATSSPRTAARRGRSGSRAPNTNPSSTSRTTTPSACSPRTWTATSPAPAPPAALAFKLRGRVGDSPIIGAGLFVDNEVGACTATGLGEAVMKTLGSFLVVELMRQGASPSEACLEATQRIAARMPVADLQVGYLAMDTQGRAGAHAIHGGFNYARTMEGETELIDAPSLD